MDDLERESIHRPADPNPPGDENWPVRTPEKPSSDLSSGETRAALTSRLCLYYAIVYICLLFGMSLTFPAHDVLIVIAIDSTLFIGLVVMGTVRSMKGKRSRA
jgi:hypothetical protein